MPFTDIWSSIAKMAQNSTGLQRIDIDSLLNLPKDDKVIEDVLTETLVSSIVGVIDIIHQCDELEDKEPEVM